MKKTSKPEKAAASLREQLLRLRANRPITIVGTRKIRAARMAAFRLGLRITSRKVARGRWLLWLMSGMHSP